MVVLVVVRIIMELPEQVDHMEIMVQQALIPHQLMVLVEVVVPVVPVVLVHPPRVVPVVMERKFPLLLGIQEFLLIQDPHHINIILPVEEVVAFILEELLQNQPTTLEQVEQVEVVMELLIFLLLP
tara:strand:- start:51 stop:428 length:378 start_codon:yes stop_codon:yes gene_type:complete